MGFEDWALDKSVSLDGIIKLREPATYLIRVGGDSMQGAGIFEDDLLVVSKAVDAVHGSIVIAAVNGDATVKRLHIVEGRPVLHPENPRYKDMPIKESDEFFIWGVVTHSVRSHDNPGPKRYA